MIPAPLDRDLRDPCFYEDGDKRVKLFSSANGTRWTAGAVIYDHAEDTPLETELWFRLLALVRMDGTDEELLACLTAPSSV